MIRGRRDKARKGGETRGEGEEKPGEDRQGERERRGEKRQEQGHFEFSI